MPSRPAAEMIPVADPVREYRSLATEIDDAITAVLRDGRYVLGPQHDEFEQEFASYVGTAHAVGTGNGTDALELALRALGCGGGDEVVTVANAGGFTTAAAELVGATPVYADVVDGSLLADVDSVRAALGRRTAAVVVTHLFGHLHPQVQELARLCEGHGVPLVEDCAQATGARVDGRHAGSFGAIGVFSFYPTKNLGALGDGGMLVTDDEALAGRARSLRQYGRGSLMGEHVPGGRNSRLDELQAAVLRVKLRSLDDFVARRREVARRYRDGAPGRWWAGAHDESYAAHLAVTRVQERDRFRSEAAAAGVCTSVHFPTLDRGAHGEALPVSSAAAGEVVTLPCHPLLSQQEADRVVEFVASWGSS